MRRARVLTAAGGVAALLLAGGLLVAPSAGAALTEGALPTDTTTGGSWSLSGSHGRTYTYGTFGYVLPDAPADAEYETGGSTTAHPSVDEKGGPGFGDDGYTGEQATYAVHGPVVPDTRSLLLPGGTQRRPATCFGEPLTVALSLPAGDYRVAVYAVDYERNGRVQTVTASVGASSASQTMASFLNGTYAVFTAHTDGTSPVSLSASSVGGPNAIVSGVFVDSLSTPVSGVSVVGLDTSTHGDWIGHYGAAGHVLCGIAAPTEGVSMPWAAGLDAADGLPGYTVGGDVHAWAPPLTAGPVTQPAYGFAWTPFVAQDSAADAASATFWKHNAVVGGPTTPGQRRGTAWDSGDDVWQSHGRPLVVDLHVPANSSAQYSGFAVGFYFRDYDDNRIQHVTLQDTTRGMTLDGFDLMSFAAGTYHRYAVPPGTDLRLTVTAVTAVNAVLSGIFLDELPVSEPSGGGGSGSGSPTPSVSPSASPAASPTVSPTAGPSPTLSASPGSSATPTPTVTWSSSSGSAVGEPVVGPPTTSGGVALPFTGLPADRLGGGALALLVGGGLLLLAARPRTCRGRHCRAT